MNIANLGWECPKCHVIHAPSVVACVACKPAAKGLQLTPEQSAELLRPKLGIPQPVGVAYRAIAKTPIRPPSLADLHYGDYRGPYTDGVKG